MADMIGCELSISGAGARVEEFLRLVKSEESDFDFNGISPYPERFKELDRIAAQWTPTSGQTWKDRPSTGYEQGGKAWCETNWGVKWLPSSAQVSYVEENGSDRIRAVMTFETPWFPP